MKKYQAHSGRSAFTLIELVVSMVGGSVLVMTLSSSLFIALKASDTSLTHASDTISGHVALCEMYAELQCSLSVTEQTPTAVTVTVPDRDDPDTAAETIRYAWSGTPGDPLTRQFNGGAVTTHVQNVHDFQLSYFQPNATLESIDVRIQVGNVALASLEMGIPLLNRP